MRVFFRFFGLFFFAPYFVFLRVLSYFFLFKLQQGQKDVSKNIHTYSIMYNVTNFEKKKTITEKLLTHLTNFLSVLSINICDIMKNEPQLLVVGTLYIFA